MSQFNVAAEISRSWKRRNEIFFAVGGTGTKALEEEETIKRIPLLTNMCQLHRLEDSTAEILEKTRTRRITKKPPSALINDTPVQ